MLSLDQAISAMRDMILNRSYSEERALWTVAKQSYVTIFDIKDGYEEQYKGVPGPVNT